MNNTAMALVKYAVSISEDHDVALLLRLWVEGDFDAIRGSFPGVPNNILCNEDIVFYNGVKYKAMVGDESMSDCRRCQVPNRQHDSCMSFKCMRSERADDCDVYFIKVEGGV